MYNWQLWIASPRITSRQRFSKYPSTIDCKVLLWKGNQRVDNNKKCRLLWSVNYKWCWWLENVIIVSYSIYPLFSMHAWVGRFLMKAFQAFLSLARSLLPILSFRSLLITSIHLNFLESSAFTRPSTIFHSFSIFKPLQSSILFYSIPFYCFSSSTEILSSGLTLGLTLHI